MIGSTGVGKTEIARRLAKLTNAPFIKVEATKYTEVGYYGRDVESMVRELVENSIGLIRDVERKRVEEAAKAKTEEKLLDLLHPRSMPTTTFSASIPGLSEGEEKESDSNEQTESEQAAYERTRAKFKQMLAAGELEDKVVHLSIEKKSSPIMMGGMLSLIHI